MAPSEPENQSQNELKIINLKINYSLRLDENDRSLNTTDGDGVYTYDLDVPSLQHTRIPYLFLGITGGESLLCGDEHYNVTSWTFRKPSEPIIDKDKSTATKIYLRSIFK